MVTIIDREEGAGEAMRQAGFRFDAVFTISEILAEESVEVPERSERRLLLHADGSSVGNPGPGGAGYVLFDENLDEVHRGSDLLGRTTNNVAEYEALIRGMQAAIEMGATDLTIRMDSSLIINQMLGIWKVKHPNLGPLYQRANSLAGKFKRIRFEYVPRERNRLADHLATQASAGKAFTG